MGILPLLKWPGGKRFLLQHFADAIPKSYNRYFEPFAGGAALFFNLLPQKAMLSDKNEELMNCYSIVRDKPEDVLAAIETWENCEEVYYQVRSLESRDPTVRAARLIYLVTLSFNGIHRVNMKGKFNVPYGQKTHVRVADRDRIISCSAALKNAELLSEDFESVAGRAKTGDFVYFDPPYTVAHGNNGFVKYNDKIFTWKDQERLMHCAASLKDRGVYVLISNADHVSIRDLYKDFTLTEISRISVMASESQFRRRVSELILY